MMILAGFSGTYDFLGKAFFAVWQIFHWCMVSKKTTADKMCPEAKLGS